jgi:hypothetical protein
MRVMQAILLPQGPSHWSAPLASALAVMMHLSTTRLMSEANSCFLSPARKSIPALAKHPTQIRIFVVLDRLHLVGVEGVPEALCRLSLAPSGILRPRLPSNRWVAHCAHLRSSLATLASELRIVMHLGPLRVPLLVQGQRHMCAVEDLLAQEAAGQCSLCRLGDWTKPGPSYAMQ